MYAVVFFHLRGNILVCNRLGLRSTRKETNVHSVHHMRDIVQSKKTVFVAIHSESRPLVLRKKNLKKIISVPFVMNRLHPVLNKWAAFVNGKKSRPSRIDQLPCYALISYLVPSLE